MSSTAIALIVFGCTSTSALLGIILRKVVPEQHLDSESKDLVKLVMGLIATIAALVLGLLIASANSSFSTQQADLQKLAVGVVELDRVLQVYGPQAQDARAQLRETVATAHATMWGENGPSAALLESHEIQARGFKLVGALHALSPKDDIQQFARNQALQLGLNLLQTRLFMLESSSGSIAWPFLAVLVGWISVLFLGFGLLARLNATVAAALLIGAVSVAAAIFLILELNEPYGGLIRLSDLPIRSALRLLGSPTL